MMKRNAIIWSVLLLCAVASVFYSCTKAENSTMYEEWQVRNYCEPHRTNVTCEQDDTTTEVLCCGEVGKYEPGKRVVLSEDAAKTYYKQYLRLIRAYSL